MESSSDTASTAGKAGRPVLLSFDEMPEWFRRESNQWILRGYRPISGSAHASFCSWSYIHNESINIYSHLIPAIFFLLGEWYIQQYLTSRYSRVTGADFIAFSIFMLAAVMCLSLSATYHTLMNHSQRMEHFCLRLDMLGIVIFILGDLVLGIYMVFWCEPLPRNIYWSMVS
jgi:adiponectin receptor